MTRLFLCNTCGKSTLTTKCTCGAIVPRFVIDPRELPKDKPHWLKEMEEEFKLPPDP